MESGPYIPRPGKTTSLPFCFALFCLFAGNMWSQSGTTSAQRHEERARQFLAEKKPDMAIPEFRAVLASDPSNLDAQANLGVLLFFRADYAGATPYLRQAVTQQPNLSKIQALLGLAEKSLGQSKEARRDLEVAVPLLTEPTISVQAGLALVELDAGAHELDKASAVLALLRQVAPTDPRVLYTAYRIATDQAGEALLSLSLAAPDSAQMHQAMAHQLEEAGNVPAAIVNLRKAAELDSHLPGVQYELAEALRSSDDTRVRTEAEAHYHLALAQDSHDARSAAALGDLASEGGDLAAATKFYQQALAIDHHLADAQIGLAHVKTESGDFLSAAPMLEEIVAADPTNTLAHYRLSTVYRKLNRPDDARRELEAYKRYKGIKEKMRAIYKQMRQSGPDKQDSGTAIK